jgi:hypothetical protein
MTQLALPMTAGPRTPSGVFSECSWACRGHGRDCLDPYCKGRLWCGAPLGGPW